MSTVGRGGVAGGARRATLAVGDSGLPRLALPGLRGLFDRSSDVVDMVTPTRPLSLNTSALRFVPTSFSADFSFFLTVLSLGGVVVLLVVVVIGGVGGGLTPRRAEAIFGPAAVAAALQLGGDDRGFSMMGDACCFFSGSLVIVTAAFFSLVSSVISSSSLLLLLLPLLLLLLEPAAASSSSSDSSSDDVLRRLSLCELDFPAGVPDAGVTVWSPAFFLGPRL